MKSLIDLDSNDGMVQTVTDKQLPDPITAAQLKGRLRIINQPDGPLTENIHDLKPSSFPFPVRQILKHILPVPMALPFPSTLLLTSELLMKSSRINFVGQKL